MIILLFFAFLAGIITVLSPCILPILPILLSAGLGQGNYRPYGIILGIIISFTFFTLTLTALVQTSGISPDLLRTIALILICFFGLTLLFPSLETFVTRITRPLAKVGNKLSHFQESSTGFVAGFIMGFALGLIWAPCAGPILATITTVVATDAITSRAILLTLAYATGTALPMLFIIKSGSAITAKITRITPYTELIRKAFGILIILSALAIWFHLDVKLQQFTLQFFPSLQIDDNELVKKELRKLQVDESGSTPLFPEVGHKAPDLKGITHWINSPELTLAQLQGKVVLIDFWTYSCINCVRTLPYLKKWYDRYKNNNFVIIGVHTPEFEFEKKASNVQDAVTRFGITYPVALDSNYATWKNYYNAYWPAHYLIDQQGIIRQIHVGEGAYVATENNIRTLIGLNPLEETEVKSRTQAQTHEIYLGSKRAQNYAHTLSFNQTNKYTYTQPLKVHQVGLEGSWHVTPESISAQETPALLTLHFVAGQVYAVMSSRSQALIKVELDGKPVSHEFFTKDMNIHGDLMVHEPRMYHVLDLKNNPGAHLLTLKVPEGTSLYAFTFGTVD